MKLLLIGSWVTFLLVSNYYSLNFPSLHQSLYMQFLQSPRVRIITTFTMKFAFTYNIFYTILKTNQQKGNRSGDCGQRRVQYVKNGFMCLCVMSGFSFFAFQTNTCEHFDAVRNAMGFTFQNSERKQNVIKGKHRMNSALFESQNVFTAILRMQKFHSQFYNKNSR